MSFEKKSVMKVTWGKNPGEEIEVSHGEVKYNGKKFTTGTVYPRKGLLSLSRALPKLFKERDAAGAADLFPAGVFSPAVVKQFNSALDDQVAEYGNSSRYVNARETINKKAKFYNENVDKITRSK